MTAIWAGVFAILGVVVGGIASYRGQSSLAARTESFARQERLRRERMEIYSSFAAASMNTRRAQFDRWYQRTRSGRESSDYDNAKRMSFELRADLRREYYRTLLVADDVSLSSAAERVVELISELHKANDRADIDSRGLQARQAVEEFIRAAQTQLG